MRYQIPIETVIGTNYTKMNVLSKEVAKAFKGSNATHLNIYIDMYPILSTIFSDDLSLKITDYLALASGILNMCIHYRDYFRTSLGVETTIFIVASYNMPDMNRKLVKDYNYKIVSRITNPLTKTISDFVNNNLEILSILCPYLPDIHYVESTYESSVVIANIINKEKVRGNDSPSLVISRDNYPIQLLSIYNDVAILRPKKHDGEDLSVIVGPINVIDNMSKIEFWDYVCKNRSVNPIYDISPFNYSILLSLIGLRDRNVKSILNITQAKRYISNVVGNMNISCSVDSLFNINRDLEEKISRMTIESRYKALDIIFQEQIFNSTTESMMMKFENRFDPEAVKMIIDRYFIKNPIDINKF